MSLSIILSVNLHTTSMIPNTGSQLMTCPLAFLLVMASPMRVNAVGSPTNPNINPDYNKLWSLEKAKVSWNGIPQYDFRENFLDPLHMAIGAISENGATLQKTALGTDPGGMAITANPHFAVASPQIREQSANRNYRLFACIMNYISPASYVYRYLRTHFTNNGNIHPGNGHANPGRINDEAQP